MVAEVRAAGGEVYGVTSEPHSLASEAEKAWDMSIPIIGDPHHEIRKDLKARGWIDIFYNEDSGHLRERDWTHHPNGYFQPAVIALAETSQILYRWRCVPKYSNMSGAGGRPEARYTWDLMREALISREDAELDREPVMGAGDLSWFKFLVIMMAHGWFLRPRAFPLLRGGEKAGVTPTQAMRRAYLFLGTWLLALIVLPITWIAIAALIYVLAIIPGLVEIHRQFQNEPDAF